MTDLQKAFAKVYTSNGFNATQAYIKINPKTPPNQAGIRGHELVKNSNVKALIDKLTNELVDTLTHSKPELLKRAHDYEVKADKAKKYETCLKSIDLQAKIAGHYTQDSGDTGQFDKIIAACQVNINIDATGDSTDATTIDITPGKSDKKDK